VHADLGAMLIGGVARCSSRRCTPGYGGGRRALRYKEDPTGRLQRTAMFVGVTTFAARRRLGGHRRGQAGHRRVHGIAPDGRPYSASDPDLVTWSNVTEAYSFLRASQLYGPRRFTQADRDQYFEEMSAVAPVGCQLGTAASGCGGLSAPDPPELYAGVQALTARDSSCVGRPTLEDRAVYAVIVGAAIGPPAGWARRELRLPSPPLSTRSCDALGTTLCTGLRWVVTAPPRGKRQRTRRELPTIVMPPSIGDDWPVT